MVTINTDDGLIKYDLDKSVGYIDVADVKLLYGKSFTKPQQPVVEQPVNVDHEAITIVDDMSLNDHVLNISGVGLITGYNMTNNNDVKHVVNIYDLDTDEKVDKLCM